MFKKLKKNSSFSSFSFPWIRIRDPDPDTPLNLNPDPQSGLDLNYSDDLTKCCQKSRQNMVVYS
jgi:hypothetical protein